MKKKPFEVAGDLPKLRGNWRGFNPRKKGISTSEIPVFTAFP